MIGQNRDTAVQTVSKGIEKLSNGHDLMICGGNFYLLKTPTLSRGFPMTRHTLKAIRTLRCRLSKWYCMAFPTTPWPRKPCRRQRNGILKSLEYGAIPSYEWYCSKTGKSELDENTAMKINSTLPPKISNSRLYSRQSPQCENDGALQGSGRRLLYGIQQ